MRVRRSIWAALFTLALATQAACSGGLSSENRFLSGSQPSVPLSSTAPLGYLYVALNGDDANPGTREAPLRTLDRASELAKPGTRVVVGSGTYQGSVTTDADGTAEARITYIAEKTWETTIVGDDSEDIAWHNTGDYVDIVGFEISGDNDDGLLNAGSYVRILNNRVHGFGEACISTANSGYTLHDIDVIGNVVYGCGENELHHGIYVSHPRGIVANNLSYGNAGYGIHCWHNCNQLTITNNLVFDNDEGGMVIGQGDGPNNGEVEADDFTVANNIAVHNGKEGIKESGATGSNNRYINNLVWKNGAQDIALKTGSESGTINADPLFVDFKTDGTGDYRLRPESPAIDAGISVGTPLAAFDGTPRPRNNGFDIGIYEQ